MPPKLCAYSVDGISHSLTILLGIPCAIRGIISSLIQSVLNLAKASEQRPKFLFNFVVMAPFIKMLMGLHGALKSTVKLLTCLTRSLGQVNRRQPYEVVFKVFTGAYSSAYCHTL